MLKLEYARIKEYNAEAHDRHGKLAVCDENGNETGESIFFHFGDGQFIGIKDGAVQFAGRIHRRGRPSDQRMPPPRVGLKVAFQRATGRDGRPKASPWTYAEDYDNCVYDLSQPRYRIMSTFFAQGTPKEVWRGYGLRLLPDQYRFHIRDGRLVDPFESSVTSYHIEELTAESDALVAGEAYEMWSRCPDPRDRAKAEQQLKDQCGGDRTELLEESSLY